MDGRCFYRIANVLMALYSGETPAADIVFDDSVIPQINLTDSLETSKFYPIPKTALLSVIWKKFHKARKQRILITNDYEIMGRKTITIVQTADHRGHVKAIPLSYGGNAASTLSPINLIADLPTEESRLHNMQQLHLLRHL